MLSTSLPSRLLVSLMKSEMNMEPNTKPTRTMKAVECDMVLSECSESDCKMSITVDKDDLNKGRKNRCLACIMASKLGSK